MKTKNDYITRIDTMLSTIWVEFKKLQLKTNISLHSFKTALVYGLEKEEKGFSGSFFTATYLMNECYIYPTTEIMQLLNKAFEF